MSTAPIQGVRPVEGVVEPQRAERPDLGDAFAKALSDARSLEGTSTHMAERFAVGDPNVGIHEVMIAAEKANIALRYATTLKNKAIEAYRELMNTQV
jgi:flagellar hook-basal body complex protein FliE